MDPYLIQLNDELQRQIARMNNPQNIQGLDPDNTLGEVSQSLLEQGITPNFKVLDGQQAGS